VWYDWPSGSRLVKVTRLKNNLRKVISVMMLLDFIMFSIRMFVGVREEFLVGNPEIKRLRIPLFVDQCLGKALTDAAEDFSAS
jgi:hypothetical protein